MSLGPGLPPPPSLPSVRKEMQSWPKGHGVRWLGLDPRFF